MKAWLVIGALLAATPHAVAAPKGKAARAAFDRGVVAYQKGDFAAAADALAQSYKLEADLETLFAWAQSERQQDNCERAIELYTKLLAMNMPAENKAAVQTAHDECKAIVDAKAQPVEPEPVPQPVPEPEPEPVRTAPPPSEGASPWWKDPIGDALAIGGVIGLGVGGYFLYSAKRAEDSSLESHADFASQQDKAESHGRIGVIATVAGGVLLVGGIVRYATRSSGSERTSVSGWVAPDGGGIAAFGRF